VQGSEGRASSSTRRRPGTAASWVVLAVVVLIGTIATGVAWVQANRSARDREQVSLDTAAAAVEEAAGTAAAALGGGAVLVDPAGDVQADRLAAFAQDVAAVSSLQAVGLVEVVPDAERSQLEGLLGRSVFRITPDGVAPAEARDRYWVVTQVVPDDDVTALLVGFDVASFPLASRTAEAAAGGRTAMISEALVVPAEQARELGAGDSPLTLLFVFKPLYRSAGSDDLAGFLVSAVNSTQLQDSLADALPEGVRYRVTDGDTVLIDGGDAAGGVSRDLRVMGRSWQLEVEDDRPADLSFALLIAAVTVGLLLILGLTLARDRRRQERLRRVDASVRGTAELARALSAAPGVPEVVWVIEHEVPSILRGSRAMVLVLDAAAGVLERHRDAGNDLDDAAPLRWVLDPAPGSALAEGRTVLDAASGAFRAAGTEGAGDRSSALVPISGRGATTDVVLVVGFPHADVDPMTLTTLETIGEICQQALTRAGATDRTTRQAGALASLAEELARCESVAEVSNAVLRSGWRPVQASAISMGLIDRDERVLRVDHGDTVAEELSQRYSAPSLDEDLAFTEAARTGQPVLIGTFDEYERRYPGTDPSNRLLGAGARAAMPLAVDDELIGAIAIAWAEDRTFDDATMFSLSTIAELTAQAVHRVRLVGRHRDDADRSGRLAAAAQQLAVISDGPTLARFVVDRAVRVSGAGAAVLVVDQAQGWDRTASSSLDAHPALREFLTGTGPEHPGAVAMELLESPEDPHDDPARALVTAAGMGSSIVLALRDRDGRPLGGMWLGWEEPTPIDDELHDVVDTLISMTSQAVARCLLTDQLRADADRNERLATFARRLANVTDVVQLVRAVIDEGGGTVGAAVANLGLVDESGERLLVTPNDFFPEGVHLEIGDRRMTDGLPGVEAVRSGEPVLIHTVEDAALRYPGPLAPTMAAHGIRSCAFFPLLTAEGEAIGCIGFGWTYLQPFLPAKLARLRTIAELCTQTLERARLADAEHRLVGTLQQRVAARTASLDSVAVATRYLPATEEIGMGGDWYDTLTLDAHRYAVVVGDVTGHGIPAVADMIELRASIRSLLLNGVPIEHVFPLVSAAWLEGTTSLATACISVVDVQEQTLHHVSAGHIPALVRAPDGSVEVLRGGRQPVLGVPGRPSAPDVTRFAPGSAVIVCSDGLIERRDLTIDESIEGLASLIGGVDPWPEDAEQQADLLLERCLAGTAQQDDVALVVLDLLRAGAAVHEQVFPPGRRAAGAARAFLTSAVPQVDEGMVLVVSELVTNAVLHGQGPVTVKVEQDDESVRLAVHDRGAGAPRRTHAQPWAASGRGLEIVDSLATDWGTTEVNDGKWVWARFERV
jgi:transcriptional regulator with GAF, ATPase, and Fis domain